MNHLIFMGDGISTLSGGLVRSAPLQGGTGQLGVVPRGAEGGEWSESVGKVGIAMEATSCFISYLI